MDDRSCMVEGARYYANFLAEESCGKCTPCREGLRQMLLILTDICNGRGQSDDITLLEKISETMVDSSCCALGKSAPNPVLTTIKYYRDEYDAHINDKFCPAGVCPELTVFKIDPDLCNGCTLCVRICPVEAISGNKREPHEINTNTCISCGVCRESCKFNAIMTIKPTKVSAGRRS